jgi:hypothetical protein
MSHKGVGGGGGKNVTKCHIGGGAGGRGGVKSAEKVSHII